VVEPRVVTVEARVVTARDRQKARFDSQKARFNGQNPRFDGGATESVVRGLNRRGNSTAEGKLCGILRTGPENLLTVVDIGPTGRVRGRGGGRDIWGFAMSALAIEMPEEISFESVLADVSEPAPTAASTHPRGRGFGVLSRLAKGQTDGEYAPRHRLDA